MPGTVCSVALCRSNSNVSKKKGETISFFTFPKNEKLRKKWIKKCYRKDKFNPENKRVCSKHFRTDDFEDVIAAKLKNTVPRKLKFDAVPSLYLLPEHYHTDCTTERTASYEEREMQSRKIIIEQLLAAAEDEHERKEIEDFHAKGITHMGEGTENDLLQEKYDKLLEENKALKDRIETYEFNLLELANRKAELHARINDLEKNFKKRIRDSFSDVFTNNQLNIILKKHNKARWTNDEMRKASMLRNISKRAYLYVRHQLKYPFPSHSSIQRWEANMQLKNRSSSASVTKSSEKSVTFNNSI